MTLHIDPATLNARRDQAAQTYSDMEPGVCDLARRTHTADILVDVVFDGLRASAEAGMSAADALRLAAANIEALSDLVADSAIMARNLRSAYYGGGAS